MKERVLCLCLALLLLLSLAACDKQAEEQDSTPPTVVPTEEATPKPTPEPTPSIPYTDVPENSFYYDAVVWAYENGVTSDDTLFEPLSTCTRGQVITFIWRAMGSPDPQITENPVSDISPSDWYYKPVLWAYESGISTSSTFKPNSPCANGEALTFLWRAEGKPMAAVNSSTVALAASGAYYERPAAWADSDGLFAQLGAAFDPTAPCSRAYLMSYLYWAEEQWASAAETRALQAEYEQIIQDAQLYEVHGSGLVYADYVDVDGDGEVELLTVAVDEGRIKATAAVYANVDGHAKKASETSFEMSIARIETYFSLCKADGQLYLCAEGLYTARAGEYQCYTSRFYRLGKGTIVLEHDLDDIEEYSFQSDTTSHTYTDSDKKISEGELKAVLQKFTDDRQLYSLDTYSGLIISISDRGLLPTPGIQVNGAKVKLSADPYISKADRVFMVPLRDVLEAMGVAVYANSDASVILASTKSDTLVFANKNLSFGIEDESWSFKDYQCWFNGKSQDIALDFTNGKAFVPIQPIVSLFGATAEWDGKAGAMQITANIPGSRRMTQNELKQMVNFSLDDAIKIGERNGHSFYGMQVAYIEGGYYISNGKAVWEYAVLPAGESPVWYYEHHEGDPPSNMYYIQVANDGTITKSW